MSDINRRQFVQYASAGLAASAAYLSPIGVASARRKVGVALVGLGYYSRGLLAPALQSTQYCELRGIVTGSPDKIPAWQKRYGIPDKNIYSYETMHQIANNPDIDVIYIVVPTSLHLKYCEIAANAGKHVWCEKPMAMTVTQCQKIINVCRKNKVQLTVGYRMQHEPSTRSMMKRIKLQPFGGFKQMVCQAGYGGNGMAADNWRMQKAMGGGAMYDMGVYPLNGARYFTGLEPIAVTAKHDKTHAHIFKEVDETTYFTLEFENDLRAECGTSVVKSFNQFRLDCQDGWYHMQPMSEYNGVQGKSSDGKRFPVFKGSQQAQQMDNDALAILGKGPILVPGEEGMRDIHVVEAAFKSASTGKRVVL